MKEFSDMVQAVPAARLMKLVQIIRYIKEKPRTAKHIAAKFDTCTHTAKRYLLLISECGLKIKKERAGNDVYYSTESSECLFCGKEVHNG